MLLARNRRRAQKRKAAEWRAAKLVQRSWRGKSASRLNENMTTLEKFGELKAITEELKKKGEDDGQG